MPQGIGQHYRQANASRCARSAMRLTSGSLTVTGWDAKGWVRLTAPVCVARTRKVEDPMPRLATVLVLALLSAGAAGVSGAGDVAWEPAVQPAVPPRARPFPLDRVRLLGGPLKASQDTCAAYLLGLDLDRLLSRYRSEAGLAPKAPPYPGWEENELPGVALGFWLSGASHLWAATGDRRLQEKVRLALDDLEECQAANGGGFLLATRNGKRLFAEIEKGDIRHTDGWKLNGEPEPYYALEKLMSGLRDAWRSAGERRALDLGRRLGDWLGQHCSHLDDAALQKLMACEFGGINWVLSDLYVDTGDARYLVLSRRWHHAAILDPLSRGEDILPGKHANTQFPKLSGLAARYPWSGDRRDLVTAQFFWDRVVRHHSYVTGGNSLAEHFGPPDRLSDRLGPATAESCNVYTMLRLTLLLEAIEPQAAHGDFIERALFGHILPAQHPADGRVCYFLPLESGAAKPYESLYGRFACCTASGMDSYALHDAYVYLRGDDTLYVNLYAPSEVRWEAKGVTVRQDTAYPDDGAVRLTFACAAPTRFRLALRCPGWASGGMALAVNGAASDTGGEPGNWVVVERTWADGDGLDLRLPLALRTESMPDDPRRVAFFAGPVLLAADLGPVEGGGPSDEPLSLDDTGGSPATRLSPVAGTPLTYTLARPEGAVRLLPFFRLHDRRYAIYWDLVSAEERVRRQPAAAAAAERLAALEARTVDRVEPGIAASEDAHGLKAEHSNTGSGAYGHYMRRRWRDAPDGWFQYQMKVLPEARLDLVATYWGQELSPRTFDILVDGTTVATHSLDGNHPEAFYDLTCPLAADITRGRTTVTVRLQAHPGNTAGGLFGLRVVERR